MEANANRAMRLSGASEWKKIAKLKEKRRQIQEQMLTFTGMDTFILDDDKITQLCRRMPGKGITFVQGSDHRKTAEQKLFEEMAAIRRSNKNMMPT